MSLPAILPNVPEIGVSQAAKILGLSRRRVQVMCQEGELETAHRPGGSRGWYKIARFEVVKRKFVKPINRDYIL